MKKQILTALVASGALLGASCGKNPADAVLERVAVEQNEESRVLLVEYARCFEAMAAGERFDATAALALSVFLGYPDYIPLFIAEGADVNSRGNGESVLHFSVLRAKNLATSKVLIENGADVNALNAGLPLLTDVILREIEKKEQKPDDAAKSDKFASEDVRTQFIDMLIAARADVNIFDGQGRSPLSAAVLRKDKASAEKMLKRGALVNSEKHAMLPLVLAAQQGDAEIATLLLDNGASTKLTSAGTSPLAAAVTGEHYAVADLLVARGANVSEEALFAQMCRSGNLKALGYLLGKGAKPEISGTAVAAEANRLDTVKFLIEKGVSATGALPHYVLKNQPEVVKFLLQNKADPNAVLGKKTAVAMAAENGFAEILKTLVQAGGNATPALPYVIAQGNTDLTDFLLKKGANPNVVDAAGVSAVELAAKNNLFPTVRALVAAGGNANVALPYAVNAGDAATVDYLLSKKADASAMVGEVSLLEIAAQKGADDVVRLLVDAGANPTPALPYYVKLHDPELVEYLRVNGADFSELKSVAPAVEVAARLGGNGKEKDFSVVKTLVSGGANPNHALPYFVKNQDEALVAFLLKNKADPNLKDDDGAPMVVLAAKAGNWKIAKLLIEEGADATSVLPYFVMNKNENAVAYLLKHGADANVELDGKPAIVYAAEIGHTAIVKLLADAGADATQALPYAVVQRNESLISFLLNNGADPNITVNNIPLVAVAAKKNMLPVVKLLVKAGASATPALVPFIETENVQGVTYLLANAADAGAKDGRIPAVVFAAQKRNSALVEQLVKAGANPTFALPYMLAPSCQNSVSFLLKASANPNTLYGVVPLSATRKQDASRKPRK